jgi:predicted negative regulator of RcsB-dependent stress response
VNERVELEQVERIKKWCRDYGVGIIMGISFAIVITIGWRYWQQTQEDNLVMASLKYNNLLNAMVDQSKQATAESIASGLLRNYPKTPYASLAALQLARQAVYQNKLTEAEKRLAWVLQYTKSSTLRAVARIRLARVLLAENKPGYALKVLDENDNTVYQPLVLEEKGNIFWYLGHSAEALQNYLAAEKLFLDDALEQPLLAMKINKLTESV